MFPPVEIMDTTLRDGEQTSGVSFNAREKLSIARLLLEELHVSRIEIASARVSQGEQQAVRAIAEWAAAKGYADRVEALGFIDGGVSLDWLGTAGCRVVNLLAKGSRKHCEGQLRRTPERHLEDVRAEILAAVDRGMKVNLYLEDWSNGMRRSPDYVYAMLDGLADAPVSRFMCPDTLGVLDPYDTERFCRDLVERYPSLHFDFHAHNDYDLAVANTAAAVRAGFHGVHVTVNGLGERAGNAPLSSAVAVLHDRLGRTTGIDETKINRVSRTVESYTGIRIPANRPIVGASVFTQCAGIHADGDSKNNLYFNELLPERFGRVREYALGKTSGKANIMKNLETLGIDLDEASMRKVTERVVELSDKKELVTAEDLPYIIADVLRYDRPKIRSASSTTAFRWRRGCIPRLRSRSRSTDGSTSRPRPATASTTPSCGRCGKSTSTSSGASSRCCATTPSRSRPAAAPTPSCRPSSRGKWAARYSKRAVWMPTRPKPPSRRRSKC